MARKLESLLAGGRFFEAPRWHDGRWYEECWRPSFARSLVPSCFGLREDLERYVRYFNFERAHLGRHTKGRTPAELVYGARKMDPR